MPTESMPGPLQFFAEHQPFTPLNEALRALLLGTPMGSSGIVAIAWCAVFTAGGLLWARRLYEKLPDRAGV